jgi:hypothetical protein
VRAAEDASPLIGASVQVKGTKVGTKTDVNGRYTLQVPADATTLVFSYIGYRTIEVVIGERTVVDVSLEIDAKMAAEIVVTGVAEGTSTKKLGFAVGKVMSKRSRGTSCRSCKCVAWKGIRNHYCPTDGYSGYGANRAAKRLD